MRISVTDTFDPADAYPVHRARCLHDEPDVPVVPLDHFRVEVTMPRTGMAMETYLATLDGAPAGLLKLDVPQVENLDLVFVQLGVHPAHRRHGLGRELLEVARRRARELGRTRLSATTVRNHPDGAAFAEAAGARTVMVETRSRFDAALVEPGHLDGLLADAERHAAGYRLVSWTGTPPDDIIDDLARMESTFFDEVPTDDLGWESSQTDADRLRREEAVLAARGRITRQTVALHEGRPAAWTILNARDGQPGHAQQQLTLVDPAHRGHRLGMLVKLANFAYARRIAPALRTIDTWNGDGNVHMLRINRLMGFRPAMTTVFWELAV